MVILQQVDVQFDDFSGFVLLGAPGQPLDVLADGHNFFFGHVGMEASRLVQEWRAVVAEGACFRLHLFPKTDVGKEPLQPLPCELQVLGGFRVGTHAEETSV